MPLVDHHALGFDGDPAREEDLQSSLLLVSCRDFASILSRISSVGGMNNSFLIRRSAIAAALSLVAIASAATAGSLPRPLGAGEQKLSPGAHVLDLVSREQRDAPTGYAHLRRIAITLPSGWYNYNGWALNDGGTLSVAFWDVAKVYPTPCRWQGKPMIDPGRTVDGLARALAAQPLRHASRPTDVALAGFRGKYLGWSVPSKIDFSRCGQGYFESWTGRGWATDRWQQGPGQVDQLWILDVRGQRLVIDASHMPWATRQQRAKLDRIVHSIKFLSASSRKTASASSGLEAGDRNGRPGAASPASVQRLSSSVVDQTLESGHWVVIGRGYDSGSGAIAAAARHRVGHLAIRVRVRGKPKVASVWRTCCAAEKASGRATSTSRFAPRSYKRCGFRAAR
jgi:hypothetical protein